MSSAVSRAILRSVSLEMAKVVLVVVVAPMGMKGVGEGVRLARSLLGMARLLRLAMLSGLLLLLLLR